MRIFTLEIREVTLCTPAFLPPFIHLTGNEKDQERTREIVVIKAQGASSQLIYRVNFNIPIVLQV